MSFVNAAKQASEEYKKQLEKEEAWKKMHSGKSNLPPMADPMSAFPEKPNVSALIEDQRRNAGIAAAVDKAEAIFNPQPDPKNPNSLWNKLADSLSSAKETIAGALDGALTTTPQTGSTAKPIVYSDWSPAAQQFGMDQQTAYAEHMANTAHQREVADLRAAGLNPVLGVGSGASGVTGHIATSGSSAQKSLNGDFIVDAIGATAAVVTAILTKNPAYGYMAGNAVNAVGDMITGSKK